MAGTMLKLGYTNPLTDSFGAHPTLGATLDLNDGVTFTLVYPGGLEMPAPPRTLVLAGNIRTQGETATRSITRHNRTVTVRLLVGPSASSAALIASIRTLLGWLASPPQTPITLQYQPFNASTPLYLDVVGASHNLPTDEGQWLRGQFEPLTVTFICRPGLRGDRVTLQNLAPNAGMEQPSKANVTVFNDAYASNASLNLYTLVAGAAPTFAAGSITLATGCTVTFGSPAWGSFAEWRVRFIWLTGLTATFYLHYTDANNYLAAQLTSTTLTLIHRIAGVNNTLNSQSFAALTNAVGYFLQISQFPSAPGEVSQVQAILSLSSGGAPAPTPTATAGPAATTDAITALTGKLGMAASGANLQVGAVNWLALYGPGGWQCATTATTVTGSGAWEGMGGAGPTSLSTANTYPNGPVSSYGALRVDTPPAGTWDTTWDVYSGGAPVWNNPGTWAIPVSANQQLAGSVWVRSSGLGVNAILSLTVGEYDASGVLLRSGTFASTTGNKAVWTQLSGVYTTGVNCAYIDISCRAADTSAPGASANATVWWDNAQVWNKTQLAAQTAMPWCDLRAVVTPATLVVSGLVGDLPAPAHLVLGTFVSSWPAGGSLSVYVGRKGTTSPKAQLQSVSYGAWNLGSTGSLDPTSYGGFNASSTVGAGGWNPRFFSATAADSAGVYHLLARVYTTQTAPNLPNISLRVAVAQQTDAWFSLPSGVDIVGQWLGLGSNPITARTTWLLVDVGQCVLPPFPGGALTDPAQLYLTPRAQWQDGSGVSGTGFTSWQVLLPVDGSLLVATVNNPTNSFGTVTNQWVWTYADGLLQNRAGASDGPVWLYSLETSPQPNPAKGAAGAGTQSSGGINVNSGADPALLLDPALVGANSSAGVNQLVALIADQTTAVQAGYAEVSYSPLYLEPR